MNNVLYVALMGGLLAILTLIHFVVDWIFQTHAEAMVKHNTPSVRARHCAIYTLGFIPFMLALHFTPLEWLVSLNVLFWSHFYLDTYHLVYLWAKFIRQPPEMLAPQTQAFRQIDGSTHTKVLIPDAKLGFIQFVSTPLGKILMIVIDQISHLLCLLPIASIALSKIQ